MLQHQITLHIIKMSNYYIFTSWPNQ